MLAEIAWNAGMIGAAMGGAIPIVALVAVYWYKTAKATSENELKRKMVERGMTVEEIERVLDAHSRP